MLVAEIYNIKNKQDETKGGLYIAYEHQRFYPYA